MNSPSFTSAIATRARNSFSPLTNDDPDSCSLVSLRALSDDTLGYTWEFLLFSDLFNIRSTCTAFQGVSNELQKEHAPWSYSSIKNCPHSWWAPYQPRCASPVELDYTPTIPLLFAFQKLSPDLKRLELDHRAGSLITECKLFEHQLSYISGFQNLHSLVVKFEVWRHDPACQLRIRENSALLRGISQNLKHLRELSLQQECVDLAPLAIMNLEKLSLHGVCAVDGIVVENLGEFLQKTKDSLTSLRIHEGDFIPIGETVCSFVQGRGLSDAFKHAGQINIKQLGLSNCGIEYGGCNRMGIVDKAIAAICDSCVRLKTLDVSGLTVEGNGMTSAGLEMVLKIPGLEALDISRVSLDELYPPISQNIPELPDLKCLTDGLDGLRVFAMSSVLEKVDEFHLLRW